MIVERDAGRVVIDVGPGRVTVPASRVERVVTGTSALSVSGGFTAPGPTTLVVLGYLVCFLALTRALRVIPISIAYAIWSGVGIALITLIGWRLFGQRLDAGEIAGIVLILAGVVVIHLFSDARAH